MSALAVNLSVHISPDIFNNTFSKYVLPNFLLCYQICYGCPVIYLVLSEYVRDVFIFRLGHMATW